MSIFIGLDLGTTGNRAIAFDGPGSIVTSAYREFEQHFPQPAWVEHDPVEIWESALAVLKDVIDSVGVDTVTGIGITNQRETTIIWDTNTGNPVYNGIVWQCRRTTEMCQSLSEHADTIKQKTGLPLDPYFSATKIKWIMDNVPETQSLLSSGKLAFGTVDSWITWKLTGQTAHVTDASNASRTLLVNLETCQYDPELLSLFDVPQEILPDIIDNGQVFGTIDGSLFGKELPILSILGDQQAALFAHHKENETIIKNTYGTGLFLVASTGHDIPRSSTLANTVGWVLNNTPHYAIEGSIFVGGSAIQWLRDGIGILKSAEDSQSMAESLDSNNDVYFVPALAGLGAPYWDPDARGLIIGLTRGTRQEHIVRAALEAMAFQTKDVVDEMLSFLPTHSNDSNLALQVDGGATHNDFLMQFQSDLLGIPVKRPAFSDITAYGAVGMAATSHGHWAYSEFCTSLQNNTSTFLPSDNASDTQSLYLKWQKAVQKSLQWH